MSAPETVLVGYYRSPGGLDALVLGELLARTLAARLLVAQVINAHDAREVDAAAEELASAVDGALARSTAAREARALAGRSAARALGALAAEEGAALVVVGSTHRAGLGRVAPGAVGDRLLAAAPCPVAIAPRGFAGAGAAEAEPPAPAERPRVIEVAFDASAQSRAALTLAAKIAEAAEATLRVVAVGAAYTEGVGAIDLQERLHEAVAALPDELRALPVYDRGVPASRLLERAEEGVDLIVMGSRGHGPLSSVLLGSTAAAVVERAPCPVIVAPARG
jgi:nucleotide-binding universal stress UspA family protein